MKAAAAAVTVAALAALLAGAASADLPRKAPARVQVVAKEFYFVLSRRSLAAGPASVQVANFGEDGHDLRLQRIGGAHIAGTPEIAPGASHDLSLVLRPGRYRLWCSIADHRQRGMHALLAVVAKKK